MTDSYNCCTFLAGFNRLPMACRGEPQPGRSGSAFRLTVTRERMSCPDYTFQANNGTHNARISVAAGPGDCAGVVGVHVAIGVEGSDPSR
jgi:hypothetical protein